MNHNAFMMVFRKSIFKEEKLKKAGLNNRQIKAVEFLLGEEKINNADYRALNECSRNTATNDLKELVEKGFLKKHGDKGSAIFYTIAHNAQ